MTIYKVNHRYCDIELNAGSKTTTATTAATTSKGVKENEKKFQKMESLTLIEPDLDSFPYTYFRRWLILALFALVVVLNAYSLNLHGDIHANIDVFYKFVLPSYWYEQIYADMVLPYVHMLLNVVVFFIAIYLLDAKGFKSPLLVGVLLTAIGCWIRCATVNEKLNYFLFLGVILCDIGHIFVLCSLVKLTAVWMGKNEVATSLAIGVASNRVGTLLTLGLKLLFENIDELKKVNYLFFAFFVIAMLCTVLFCVVFIFVQNSPLRPPSMAQCELRRRNKSEPYESETTKIKSFSSSIADIFWNRNFILMLISYGILIGAYNSVFSLLTQVFIEFDEDNYFQTELFQIAVLFSGIVGSLLGGILLDRFKFFKLFTCGTYALAVASFVSYLATLSLNTWFPLATLSLFGMFVSGFNPIGYEFTVELTYPIHESTSCGFLNVFAYVLSVFFRNVEKTINLNQNSFYGNLFISLFLFVGLCLSILVQKDLRREQVYDLVDMGKVKSTARKNSLHLNDSLD